ncbi:MAG: hypothetical protein R2704_06975, partial [Microthrixaceae bacterium]
QAVWGAAESDFTRYEVPSNMLTAGTNTIAVSVHQNWRTSADLTFDAGLSIGRGTPANPTPTPNIAVAPPVVQGTALVAADANWAYLDDGSDQGTAWVAPGFADGAWSVGPAQLGYGDGDEATVIDEGRTGNGSRAITSYFRHGFDVANPAAFNELALGLLRDDGAIVYLNGTELLRDNMPAGNVAYNTPAADYAWGAGETDYQRYTAPSSLLVPGRNVLAVEVHSANPGSNDISFALTLDGV